MLVRGDGHPHAEGVGPLAHGSDLVGVGTAGPHQEIDGDALRGQGVDRIAVGEPAQALEGRRDRIVVVEVVGHERHDLDR